jgi:signal transduction histidine kinase/GAF domain-containing protein
MDLKDAVDLYRDVLQRYSEGFSLEEILGSVVEALGGTRAVLFSRRDMSSFLEPRLVWNIEEADRETIRGMLIPIEWITRQPAHRYVIVDKEGLAGLGMGDLSQKVSDVALLFPIRTHAHLRAALLAVVPEEATLPDQQSFKVAAICAVLERMVEPFTVDDKQGWKEGEKEAPSVELGILSNYLMGRVDSTRAASLSLDLLIKLLNMDGGTIHRVRGILGEQQSTLITSRGWGGMPEIIEHLFENKLIDLLQTMRHAEERDISLDAGRIAEYFPGVKPYFHANQVRSFLLTPIFQDDKLVGLLTLFGKAYTAMEPRDMELLVHIAHRLGDLFSEEDGEARGGRGRGRGWDFPALTESLFKLSESADDVEDFISSALSLVSVDLGASMAFAYFGEELSIERSFLWYADAIYGGESVFKATPGLSRMASHLQRMAVVKPDNPAMKEMPAAEQAIMENLVLLLIPIREMDLFLMTGYYLPGERRLTKVEMDSLQPLSAMILGLARWCREKAQAKSYRRSLEILTEVEGDLAACEDLAHALRILARGGRELLNCDRAAILVVDEVEGTFEGAVETLNGSETGDLSLLAGREIALSLERGHAIYSLDVEKKEDSLSPGDRDRSFIAVPLIGRKGRLGAMVFEKTDQRDFFGEFQRRLAHFLAGQAVSILESRREGARMEYAAEETRVLLRISKRISLSFTMEDMCKELYEEFEKTVGADLLLLSIHGKAGVRRLAWLKGKREEVEAFDELLEYQGPLMLSLSPSGKLIRNNLNTFIQGPGEDGLALKGIRSYMAVSLQGEDMKGVLLVGSTRGAAFSGRESALIEKAAGLINSSMAMPQHQETLQSRIRFLEEVCREQEEKVKTKTDLINMASHEIRHPLTLIMGFSEVLRDYGDTLDAQESREVAGKLQKAADRLRRSVVNMMEISNLESGKMDTKTEEMDLGVLLGGLVEELQARSIDHVIEVEVEKEAERIFTDRDKLEIVVFNLMDNAVKYSPPGSKINVFAKRSGREILIGVRDQGQGISEEHLATIFQPFRRGDGREQGSIKGMGLGLYIVNKLVEALGGRIDVRSEHGRGSTFIARMPQPELGNKGNSYRTGTMRA